MPRPRRCCRVSGEPACRMFKPSGIPAKALEQIGLTVEELEALRLADMQGLYHETAAEMMGVSRATFGRVLQEARRKVATALVAGMALKIDGGNYHMSDQKEHVCCGGKGRKNRTEADQGAGCGCGTKTEGHGEAGPCHDKGPAEGGQAKGTGCCCTTGKPE